MRLRASIVGLGLWALAGGAALHRPIVAGIGGAMVILGVLAMELAARRADGRRQHERRRP